MGGGEVLTLASTQEYEDLMPHIRGFLLEAPFIALSHKANPFTLIAGRLAGRLLPHFQIKQPIPPKDLSRDQEVVKSLEEDPYCDGTGTLEMFANMLDRASGLEKGLLKLNKGVQALWLSHGTKDLACSYAASKEWFERQDTVVDKTFKTYDGWYHQLHADLPEDRPVYAKDVGDWILERVGGTSAYDAAQAVPPHEFVKEGLTSSDDAGTSASVPSKENHSKL
jgi:acylglycerol lipase